MRDLGVSLREYQGDSSALVDMVITVEEVSKSPEGHTLLLISKPATKKIVILDGHSTISAGDELRYVVYADGTTELYDMKHNLIYPR